MKQRVFPKPGVLESETESNDTLELVVDENLIVLLSVPSLDILSCFCFQRQALRTGPP